MVGERSLKDLPEDLQQIISDIAMQVHAKIIENTPVAESVPADPPYTQGHTGGRLRNSIVIEHQGDQIIIGTTLEYAEAVEVGVDPHPIDPVNAEALKFFVPGKGYVFAGHVNHPGFEGRGMFKAGQAEAEKLINQKFTN